MKGTFGEKISKSVLAQLTHKFNIVGRYAPAGYKWPTTKFVALCANGRILYVLHKADAYGEFWHEGTMGLDELKHQLDIGNWKAINA